MWAHTQKTYSISEDIPHELELQETIGNKYYLFIEQNALQMTAIDVDISLRP